MYICYDCNKEFIGKSGLSNHIKNGCPNLRKSKIKYCPNPQNNPKCSNTISGNKTCKSCSLFGRLRPPEVGLKISKYRKNRPLSIDHKRKIKENANPYQRTEKHRSDASNRIKGENNYFYGKGDRQTGNLNYMYGKTLKGIWIEKYGLEEGSRKWQEHLEKVRSNRKKEFVIDWMIVKNTYCDDIKKYRRLVDKFVNRLDISILFGYEFRGKISNSDHAWNLDHIVSIKYGFINNIDPKLIGSIENLRFIPWRHNNRKGESIITNDNYDGHLNRLSHKLLVNWFGLPKLKRIS